MNDEQVRLVDQFNRRMDTGEIAMETVPCLCGNDGFALLAEYDRYRIRQRVVICSTCGLVQNQPRMTRRETEKFYASDAYRKLYDPDIFELDRQGFDGYLKKTAYRHDLVSSHRNGKAPDKVLEIGCGGGWNLYPYMQDGARVVGYDHGPALVEFGRGLGMDLRTGSIDDVEGDEFDLIVLSHVVEHFLDPVGEVRKLAARLKNGGMVYIEVPNVRHFCLGGLQNAHTYYFSPATLIHYMSRAGLKPLEEKEFGSHLGMIFGRNGNPNSPGLDGEYETMVSLIRAYEKKERAKSLLDGMGLLSLARGVKGLLGK